MKAMQMMMYAAILKSYQTRVMRRIPTKVLAVLCGILVILDSKQWPFHFKVGFNLGNKTLIFLIHELSLEYVRCLQGHAFYESHPQRYSLFIVWKYPTSISQKSFFYFYFHCKFKLGSHMRNIIFRDCIPVSFIVLCFNFLLGHVNESIECWTCTLDGVCSLFSMITPEDQRWKDFSRIVCISRKIKNNVHSVIVGPWSQKSHP